MTQDESLKMFVIYQNPRDYPGKYVVRAWDIGSATISPEMEPRHVSDSIEGARDSLPPGLMKLDRAPFDDEVIVETWI